VVNRQRGRIKLGVKRRLARNAPGVTAPSADAVVPLPMLSATPIQAPSLFST
jgi:hypothetical protein